MLRQPLTDALSGRRHKDLLDMLINGVKCIFIIVRAGQGNVLASGKAEKRVQMGGERRKGRGKNPTCGTISCLTDADEAPALSRDSVVHLQIDFSPVSVCV